MLASFRRFGAAIVFLAVASFCGLLVQVQQGAFNLSHVRAPVNDPTRSSSSSSSSSTSAISSSGISPACRPSFGPGGRNVTKLYFYHPRKAGGTSLRYYLQRVAREYGLAMKEAEYEAAESPFDEEESESESDEHETGARRRRNTSRSSAKFGSEETTLYVTVLRDPVSRSISHFKYTGRWPCGQLVTNRTFVPDLTNAAPLATWVHSGGHSPAPLCERGLTRLGDCAADCYSRWFSDHALCGADPVARGNAIARRKLYGYHLIVVMEWLSDPAYVRGLESMFGVVGYRPRDAWCQKVSRSANAKYPLMISDAMRERLSSRNELDRSLYEELTTCPSGVVFPPFDSNRFQGNGTYVCYKVGVASGRCDEPKFLDDEYSSIAAAAAVSSQGPHRQMQGLGSTQNTASKNYEKIKQKSSR